jgi:hypothetical protein
MIVFDLECRAGGHRFEGWFASSDDFADQQARGLVSCPTCGALEVSKALSPPHLGRKGNRMPEKAPMSVPMRASMSVPVSGAVPAAVSALPTRPQPMVSAPMPPETAAILQAMAAMQTEMLKSSTWVGENFAEDVRAMHYGEKDAALVHGRASPGEVRELLEEGIPVAPVLVPVAPPGEVN